MEQGKLRCSSGELGNVPSESNCSGETGVSKTSVVNRRGTSVLRPQNNKSWWPVSEQWRKKGAWHSSYLAHPLGRPVAKHCHNALRRHLQLGLRRMWENRCREREKWLIVSGWLQNAHRGERDRLQRCKQKFKFGTRQQKLVRVTSQASARVCAFMRVWVRAWHKFNWSSFMRLALASITNILQEQELWEAFAVFHLGVRIWPYFPLCFFLTWPSVTDTVYFQAAYSIQNNLRRSHPYSLGLGPSVATMNMGFWEFVCDYRFVQGCSLTTPTSKEVANTVYIYIGTKMLSTRSMLNTRKVHLFRR